MMKVPYPFKSWYQVYTKVRNYDMQDYIFQHFEDKVEVSKREILQYALEEITNILDRVRSDELFMAAAELSLVTDAHTSSTVPDTLRALAAIKNDQNA